MRSTCIVCSALVLSLTLAWAANVRAADKTDSDVRALQRQLRNRDTSQRVEALKKLQNAPSLSAAKVIVPSQVSDPAVEVRRAAYETLVAWKEDAEVGAFLLKSLEKESRNTKNGFAVIVPLVAVLLASEASDVQQDFTTFLDGYVAKSKESVLVLTTVADELGKQDDAQSLASLRKMTELKCFSTVFACRRAVIGALIQIHLPETIETLIALLPKVDGEVRADILRYLPAVTGKQLGVKAESWQAWWKEHKDGFHFPGVIDSRPPPPLTQEGQPSYYGLAIQARRMVFVVDVSGSMAGPRLMALQRELTKAISDLPEASAFNITLFNTRVMPWRPTLAPAKLAAKQAARQFIAGLTAGGHTDAYDALDSALHLDTEAIYFLSDGEPNTGKIVATDAIVAAISQANRSRRISIYTICIEPGSPGGRLDAFMKTLAEQNYGAYRRIDQ